MLAFDALRFQDKLSFRLSELIEDGVGGSSGLDSGPGDFGARGLLAAGSRGPDGRCCVIVVPTLTSAPLLKPLPVLVLLCCVNAPEPSNPPLGSDEDRYGDTDGFCAGCRTFIALIESVEFVSIACPGLSVRIL